MPSSAPVDQLLAKARLLLAEERAAEAASLLESDPVPVARALHLQIAIRAARTALKNNDIATTTAWLDRGLRVTPADPVLNFFRGNLYQDAGELEAAIACFRHCVAADPNREEFVCNLGQALLASGAAVEAEALLRPLASSAQALINLGVACERQGELTRALTAYEAATRKEPALFLAWLNLGAARLQHNDLHGALQAYNRAVALQPSSPRVHLERGQVFARLKQYPEAVASFSRCLALDPGNSPARLATINARSQICDWSELEQFRCEFEKQMLPNLEKCAPPTPFSCLSLPLPLEQHRLRAVAIRHAARILPLTTTKPPAHHPETTSPLRIGYVSPDFGNHAVGNCLRSLFARHDRARVSVHGFSLAPSPDDEFRSALRAGCDTWDDLHALDDRAAAQRLTDCKLDLLIDLAGHTKGNRLRLFAARPAPLQLTWLGYPGTTGAPFIDYLLADEYLIPSAEESAFTEKIVRLPGCYLPTDDTVAPADGHDSRAEHGLPETGFVFCAFNNSYKIEPFLFGTWMEILRRTPGAVLWLRSAGPEAEVNLRREAETRGIDPARLVFENRGLSKPLHLARHRAAGLYLDTHFYNAHSTAADALRAGLPVLTLPGRSFPSRVGLSLVSTLGLADELAATSRDDYVERAVQLATHPDSLAALRARLADAIKRPGGLFDTTAFARKLEVVFRELVERR